MSKLKEKHGQQYDTEGYACWAHTIQSGKHSSYDEPPDLPYFTRCKRKATVNHVRMVLVTPTKQLVTLSYIQLGRAQCDSGKQSDSLC